jgi:hypothetical protein
MQRAKIARNQKIYAAVPPARRARKPVPDQEPRPAEDVLAPLSWRRMTWRQGTKGALTARFAALRVRVGDGLVWANNRHLPSEEAWLVGEWRSSGERPRPLAKAPPARNETSKSRTCGYRLSHSLLDST